jgi:cytochrome P450
MKDDQTMTSIGYELPITDYDFWAHYPAETFRWLRAESPVHYCEPEQVWLITKYDDVKSISRDPGRFASRFGFDMGTSFEIHPTMERGMERAQARGACERARTGGRDNVIGSDAARHRLLRKMFNVAFTPRAVALLEEKISVLTQEMIGRIEPGVELDFVEAVAAEVPCRVIAAMLGVPDSDIASFRTWSDLLIEARDVSLSGSDVVTRAKQAYAEFNEYFAEKLAECRRNPQDDLLTALAAPGEEAFSEQHQLTAARLLLLAGNETTRSLIANAGELMCQHPDQRRLLAENPGLMEGAVEEFLRFSSPVKQMARTAVEDVVIRGQEIATGDTVVLVYPAANRDEDCWPDSDRLDVTRVQDPSHIAFGFAEHFCLGASLARREARVVLNALLSSFPTFELTGEATRMRSYMVPNITKMPVRFGT